MSSSPDPGSPSAAALRRLLPEMEAGLGARTCIVGGYVRDLLLGREAGTDVEGKAYQGDCYSGPVDDPTSEADWAPDIPV